MKKMGYAAETEYVRRVQSCFDIAAEKYEESAQLQKQVAEKLCLFLLAEQINKQNKVLDIGCGTGNISKILGHQNLYSIDLSLKMCLEASKVYPHKVISCDMNRMPFREDTFETIVSSMAIHWSVDLEHTFKNVIKVLRKGGKFFFSLPVQGTQRALQICSNLVGGRTPHKFYDLETITRILRALGLEILYTECIKYQIKHNSFIGLLTELVKMGGGAWRGGVDGRKRDLRDVIQVHNNLHTRTPGAVSTWYIAYFVTQK